MISGINIDQFTKNIYLFYLFWEYLNTLFKNNKDIILHQQMYDIKCLLKYIYIVLEYVRHIFSFLILIVRIIFGSIYSGKGN